jgi:hypothetical protein
MLFWAFANLKSNYSLPSAFRQGGFVAAAHMYVERRLGPQMPGTPGISRKLPGKSFLNSMLFGIRIHCGGAVEVKNEA